MIRQPLIFLLLPLVACATSLPGETLASPQPIPDAWTGTVSPGDVAHPPSEPRAPVGPHDPGGFRNVPAWRPLAVPPGSVALIFEPGNALLPVALVWRDPKDQVTVVVFLGDCPSASGQACPDVTP